MFCPNFTPPADIAQTKQFYFRLKIRRIKIHSHMLFPVLPKIHTRFTPILYAMLKSSHRPMRYLS